MCVWLWAFVAVWVFGCVCGFVCVCVSVCCVVFCCVVLCCLCVCRCMNKVSCLLASQREPRQSQLVSDSGGSAVAIVIDPGLGRLWSPFEDVKLRAPESVGNLACRLWNLPAQTRFAGWVIRVLQWRNSPCGGHLAISCELLFLFQHAAGVWPMVRLKTSSKRRVHDMASPKKRRGAKRGGCRLS